MSLWLITEEQAQVDYFIAHGIVPTSVLLSPTQFSSVSTYLGAEANILIVIHGLTNFKVSEINQLCKDLISSKELYKSVTIFCDIKLNLPLDYYLYEGDIFEGNISLVQKGKQYSLDSECKPILKESKKTKKLLGNPILLSFTKYNKQDKADKMNSRLIQPQQMKSMVDKDDTEDILFDRIVCFERKNK